MSDFSNKRKCNVKVLVKEFIIMREVNGKEKTETEVTEVYGILESGL
jgi:hypothetical protein